MWWVIEEVLSMQHEITEAFGLFRTRRIASRWPLTSSIELVISEIYRNFIFGFSFPVNKWPSIKYRRERRWCRYESGARKMREVPQEDEKQKLRFDTSCTRWMRPNYCQLEIWLSVLASFFLHAGRKKENDTRDWICRTYCSYSTWVDWGSEKLSGKYRSTQLFISILPLYDHFLIFLFLSSQARDFQMYRQKFVELDRPIGKFSGNFLV